MVVSLTVAATADSSAMEPGRTPQKIKTMMIAPNNTAATTFLAVHSPPKRIFSTMHFSPAV